MENTLGLEATTKVFSALKEIVSAGEIVLADGKFTFSDIGAVMPVVMGGTIGKLVENLPQMMKELNELTPQEAGQVVAYGWQVKDDIKALIEKVK